MKKIKIALISTALIPLVSFAQVLGGTSGLLGAGKTIIETILVPLAFMLCLLYFFWGVAKYIRTSGEEKQEGKMMMVWGVVAIFVVASIWGLVRFLRTELGINQNENISVPGLVR